MTYSKLIGVYNAEGSIAGEIRYFLGKLTGSASCSLCDISHKLITEKSEFAELKQAIPQLQMLHLDETDHQVTQLVNGNTPCVVGYSNDQWQIIIDKDTLDNCTGSVSKFSELLWAKIQ